MLRSPHLNWDAGYTILMSRSAQLLRRLSHWRTLQTISGFGERLGFSTTNNDVDPDEIYLLDADPAQPDHYLFDGLSLPLRRIETTLPYRSGAAVATETRISWATNLGPVIHRADGKLHVWKVAGFEQFQLAERWLG
jgi:acyl-homoserine-lactone acylase